MDPAIFEKLRGMNQKATADIEAVLNSSQKAKLPGVMKEFQALGSARIPFGVVPELKLTADQGKRLQAVGDEQEKKRQALVGGTDRNAFRALREETQQKVEAILTADQKATVKKYEDAHPRPGRGGGGRGGRAGGAGTIS
jgi:hypothetical protein